MQELIIVDERTYEDALSRVLQSLNRRTCYVAMNKQHTTIIQQLQQLGLDPGNIHIVDTLSSHYAKPAPLEGCTFLPSAADFSLLLDTLLALHADRRCEHILFDPITELLFYRPSHDILQFVNRLRNSFPESVEMTAIALTDGEPEHLASFLEDLRMFADQVEKHVLNDQLDGGAGP